MQTFDTIVIGVGGIGSGALHHLASRGQTVLGIERFDVAHDRGSSHGQTRIIRRAYFEHPAYIPLVDRSYALWADLEEQSGRTLVFRTGLLLLGRRDGAILSGVHRATAEHELRIEEIPGREVSARFPGFLLADDMDALFEPDAGYLAVEDCIRAQVERAVGLGATLVTGERVRRWSATASGVEVETSAARYAAANLVICAGAWTNELLGDARLPLEIRRKVVLWFDTANDNHFAGNGCPVFGFDTDVGLMYGFPAVDRGELKVGHHAGGETVGGADDVDRDLHAADVTDISRFVERHLPGAVPTPTRHSVCMYTMTPDEHFIVDRHPEHDNVFLAAGFSGHGFKFAPVIGSALADLVTAGHTDEPIGFMGARRPALQR